MEFHRHRFHSVEQYLHHRPPYLMVDEIKNIDTKSIVTKKTIESSMTILQGHFPGAPVFPGAMMQEFLTQTAGILIAANYNPMESYDTADPSHNPYALGVLVKVNNARYKSFARPGDELTGQVQILDNVANLFQFKGKIEVDQEIIMRINFTLANVESKTLINA